MAIAYALKKKAKKMADGGDTTQAPVSQDDQDKKKPFFSVDSNDPKVKSIANAFKADGGPVQSSKKGPYMDPDKAKAIEKGATSGGPTLSQAWDNLKKGLSMSDQDKYADGGFIEEEKASGYVDHMGDDVKHNEAAENEDERKLNQHGRGEVGPLMACMADGGFIGSHQSDDHMMDMVGRIMKQRQMCYSEGGKVANGGEDELSHMADGKPNNFDDLSMRDDLKENYTGANSGDEIGNAQEEDDRHDIISRIMKSRAKKDRMPHPA